MPLLPDLVTLSAAQDQLSAALPPGLSSTTLPSMITAASSAVRRFCARDFTQWDYDECYDGKGFTQLALRQYPINGRPRLYANLSTVLTVANTSTANQFAWAGLTVSGDQASGLVALGILLTSVASGVTTADASTLFATYTTLGAVAAHINALGNGWSATVAQGYALWPSAQFRAIQGDDNAIGTGAQFQLHVSPLTGWTMNERNGILSLASGAYGPLWAMQGGSGSFSSSTFTSGFQGIRAQYNAGYAVIPGDVQIATMMTISAFLWDLRRVWTFQREKLREWEGELAPAMHRGFPQAAKDVLLAGGWKSYRIR